jgi:hypothetical protein
VIFSKPLVSLPDLSHDIVSLLPEYLPGVATGPAAPTEGRSCWIRAWKALLTTIGRRYGAAVESQEDGGSSLEKQLTLYWKQGDGIAAAFLSGFGDREELEHRFQRLESIKAPQKAVLFSCSRWQDAVMEQLGAALLRYPHHIEGEQYLTLNLLGNEQRLAVYEFTVPRNGPLDPHDLQRLAPLPGSPFRWGK